MHFVRIIQKIAATILAIFTTAALMPAYAASVDDVAVASAALVSNTSAISGMVRVYLSSLGSPTTLNLTIAGNYSVNGDSSQSLSNGSTVSVGFDTVTGAITLTRDGSRTNMGKYFALRRHSTSGSNGIKISQAKVSANPYPGDISFRAVQQGSGSYKLYTVAHIYIEDYLYGVLPYEMGNSSNIEALKAQAVAARTYTVRMMQSRASGYYDVVDTTNDQVYRGTPSGNANCVAAVEATKGIVVKNGSSYTMTYYSASNGGQTESVKNAWGTSGYDYLMVKDDPFDYANPSSTVKSKTVYTDLTSASNPSGLISLLKTKAASKLGVGSANVTLQTLKSVTPHTPMYSSPSRLYTKMDFAMTVQTGSGTSTVTVTCDIFSELESLLSMSIQSGKNELWSVVKNASSFTLQSRRYGHGLGMSQRGAMYMGKLGYTYDEILGFYYNNCKRVRQSFTHTILSATGDEQTTVEDAADLTEEDATACKGTVKLVSSSASLAIRTAKATTASMIGTLGNGAIVKVLTNDGTWCYIQYGNLKGYVPSNALTITGTPSGTEGEITSIQGFATVTASDYVNLRQSGSTSAAVLSTAPNGAVLTVFAVSGGWAQVQYCSTVAYVNTSFISQVTSAYPSNVVSTGSATATVKTEDGTGSVNLRSAASADGGVVTQIPNGAQVTVTSDDGSWATVSYNGLSGYVMSSFLSYDGESLENNNNADSNGNTSDGSAQTGVYATVSTDIAYLREQPSTESASKLMLIKGDTVKVTEKGDSWCVAQSGDTSGYILTAELTFSGGQTAAVAKAVVTTASGSLNMRAQGKAGSQVLTTIPKGAEIDVTQVGDTWCAVYYNGLNGYVMTSFLTFTQGGTGGGADNGTGSGSGDGTVLTATVTTQSGSLNLRSEARSGSAILRTIPQYAAITVHSKGSEWCQVTYMETTGYVMTVFLTFTASDSITPTLTPLPTDTPAPGASDTATVTTVSGSLNLRVQPAAYAGVLTTIPQYATVNVLERGSEWCSVSYGSLTGYVMTRYLTFSPSASATPSPTPTGVQPTGTDAQPTATPAPQSLTATVHTVTGSLNMRLTADADGQLVTTIPQGASVTVTSHDSVWCLVTYNGMSGYVMTRYLSFGSDSGAATATPQPTGGVATPTPQPTGAAATATPQPTGGESPAWVLTVSGALNLRASAVSGSQVLLGIPRLAQVSVLSDSGGWAYVRYNGYTGYVMSQFLTYTQPGGAGAVTPAPSAPPTNGAAPTPSPVPNLPPVLLDGTLRAVARETWALTSPRENEAILTLWPECRASGAGLAAMPHDVRVKVLMIGDEWCMVRYEDYQQTIDGYCLTEFLTLQEP